MVHKNTNPRYKNFVQEVFTAGDEDQFTSARIRTSLQPRKVNLSDNLFKQYTLVPRWEKYDKRDSRAVLNTFRYMFYKFKKGIFVRISDNKLATFLPFSNAHYHNEFSDLIKVDPRFTTIQEFLDYAAKLGGYKPRKAKPVEDWYANNALLRFEYEKFEGDNNVVTLRDMFQELCDKREVPDVEFFVNRRDYPVLRVDSTEPYNHIWGSKHPLVSHEYEHYAPILSGSSGWMYADIAFPTYEDWARSVYQDTGKTFPNEFREYPKIVQVPWNDKIPVAVFRGSTTGAGTTPETNQRLKAYEMAEGNPHMDVGITKWNVRVRKNENDPYLKTIERSSYPLANRLSLQEQAKYKYIINLEGHVAAYRLSYELSSGSTIIMPTDNKWNVWYFRFLGPYKHYVPISADLHNLESAIDWCRNNDEACKQIAARAKEFYDKYLGEDGILDFLQKELVEIATPYEYLPDLLELQIEDELKQITPQEAVLQEKLPYPIKPGPRCVGVLGGCKKVFDATDGFKLVKPIMKNQGGDIDLYETNRIFMVGKRAGTPEKRKEHIHEAYVGLKALNSVIAKVPNFSYIYGLKGDVVYGEYIQGTSMFDWLKSPSYTFDGLLSILMQINMALHVAQQEVGFMHYDLYPWNVMLQPIKAEVEFDYHIRENHILRCKTSLIPVMVDFGKSRVVVHEEEYGCIDHGFVNLYQTNSILDTLTLLLSCISNLKSRLTQQQMDNLLGFIDLAGLSRDVERHRRYGKLFQFQNRAGLAPMDFVNYIIKLGKIPPPIEVKEFDHKMERGNPIQTYSLMKYNDEDRAIMDVVVHIDKSTLPRSDNNFFQELILGILHRRTKWLDADVLKRSDLVKAKWARTKKLLYLTQPKLRTVSPTLTYPRPDPIYLDSEIPPEELKRVAKHIKPLAAKGDWVEDWPRVLSLTLDASLMGLTLEGVQQFLDIDNFFYHNALASNNTLLKLAAIVG